MRRVARKLEIVPGIGGSPLSGVLVRCPLSDVDPKTQLLFPTPSPLDRRDIERLAQGYAPQSQRLFGLPSKLVDDGALVFDPSLEWTGGGLVTSSADLVRWALALFEGKALGRGYVDEMLTSIAVPERFADDPGRLYGYGLGISIARTRFGVAYRHGGFFPGYNFVLAWFPERGFAVAMQINSDASNIEAHFDAIVATIVASIARNQAQAESLSGDPLAITFAGRQVVRNERIRAHPR